MAKQEDTKILFNDLDKLKSGGGLPEYSDDDLLSLLQNKDGLVTMNLRDKVIFVYELYSRMSQSDEFKKEVVDLVRNDETKPNNEKK